MKWPWTKNAARRMRGMLVRGFEAARTDRLLAKWQWDGGFTANEISASLATIRARSRQMEKDSPHYRKYLSLCAINIVGEGFALKSTPHDGFPGDKGYRLDDKAAQFIMWHFWRWSTYRDPETLQTWCDACGKKTLPEIDRLNARVWARDGEYFTWVQRTTSNPYGISLRLIRPDAVDHKYNHDLTPQRFVRCGVEFDRMSMRPIAYYVRTTPDWAYVTTESGPLARIPAGEIIHGFTPHDEDQPRGVPFAHAALVKMKMLDEYDRAELTAARDESCSVRSYYAPKGDDDEIADLTSDENSDVANALTMDKEPGQSEVLPIGWKQEIHTPQHPNRESTPFKASMLRDVASGLGVEYASFCNDWAGVSFSSVRQGVIAERDMWVILQNEMIAQYKSPVFLAWLKSFLALSVSGGLPENKFGKFAEHEFRGRRWMWVDPVKDMNAAKMARDEGWKTDAQIAGDMGCDIDENIEETKRVDKLKVGTSLEPKKDKPPVQATTKEVQDDEEE